MPTSGTKIFAIATAALAFGLPASSALAVDTGAQQPRPQQAPQQQAPSFAESELEAYAEAAIEISELQRQYQGQLQQAETAEQQQAVQEQANVEITGAIEEAGISIEKYQRIATAVQNNPQLAQEVRAHVEEIMQNSSGG